MDKYCCCKHKIINDYLGYPNFMDKLNTKNNHLYNNIMGAHIDDLVGGGFLDRLKGVFFGRKDYPPAERKLIEKYGNSKILKIEIYREPLEKMTKLATTILTLGQIDSLKKKYNYDELYHLFLVITVDFGVVNVPIRVEKHEIINIHEYPKIAPNAERFSINLRGYSGTFREFLKNGENRLGDKYWFYNAFDNNCQIFVLNLLEANPPIIANNPTAKAFIYQDVTGLTADLNPVSKNLINLGTGLKSRLNVLLKGYGDDIDDIINQKPSAYRSMQMAKFGFTKPVKKNNQGDLERWTQEQWLNLNALLKNKELPCGKKYEGQTSPTVCRPKLKISNKTPMPLAYDLSPTQIRNAINIKKQNKRVNWQNV